MPTAKNSHLQTVSFVLTREQVRRMRALSELRSSELRKVNFSEIVREVVERGLGSISQAPFSDLSASDVTAKEPVAA